MENKKYILLKSVTMMNGVNRDLCEDYDDDGELDVEYYPVPEALLKELYELSKEGK